MIHESSENYLKQILIILMEKGHVRSVDIAERLGVTKGSVSIAMKKLRENGYINMGSDNLISLTDKGYAIARKILDRYRTLTRYLVQIGVPEEQAGKDACRIEHNLSESTYAAIQGQIRNEQPMKGRQGKEKTSQGADCVLAGNSRAKDPGSQ